MLDPRPGPKTLGPVDAMATDAVGSFAWWCRWFLDAWDDDYPPRAGTRERHREERLSSSHRSTHAW